MVHPLVRDLYKRVLIVSKDYPTTDYHHVKQLWKTGIRNPDNCPSWYTNTHDTTTNDTNHNHSRVVTNTSETTNDMNELYHAVHRGRQMVKEMIGIVQLHKYRTMKQRYNNNHNDANTIAAANELFQNYNNTMDQSIASKTTNQVEK
jgi:hypothetical protein